MLKYDSCLKSENNFKSNVGINSINIDVISAIQKKLSTYDIISMVFLLYDVPDTALQRLIVFQRISKHVGDENMSLLHDWAVHAQQRPTWRYEFLEALTICQLYSIIRKLGLDVTSTKTHYLPNNLHTSIYINPMKKALYKLCEAINSDNLIKLKQTLLTYNINSTECDSCELVFLKLMCDKFIVVNQFYRNKTPLTNETDIGNLVNIIENLSGLKSFGSELREIEVKLNHKVKLNGSHKCGTPTPMNTNESYKNEDNQEDKFQDNFNDVYELINELHIDDVTLDLKSDTKKLEDAYMIHDTKRVGVCYIINQEKFHPSQRSIQNRNQSNVLDDRHGSTRDKIVLESTMAKLNFEVISSDNLEYEKMLESIKNVIKYRVRANDSIFMLCILSHGFWGHVYAADSVEVSVNDIQKLLDSEDAKNLRDKPKVLILQACQVNKVEVRPLIVADSPSSTFYLKKLDFLIYWATAPEYEAYRNEKKGSIFIQILCGMIQKYGKEYQLNDIFTKVTDSVTRTCTILERAQVPIFKSTLRKKLYLQIPL